MGTDRETLTRDLEATARALSDEDIHAAARHWLSRPIWQKVLVAHVDDLLPGDLRTECADLPERLLEIEAEDPDNRMTRAQARQYEAMSALESAGYGTYDAAVLDRTASALLSLLRERVDQRMQKVFRPDEIVSSPARARAPTLPDDRHRDEREVSPDTLLSVAGKTVLDLRREAKGGGDADDDRYQERLENALAAFIPFDSIQTSPAAGRPPPRYTEVKIGDGLEFRFLSGEPVLQIRDVIQSARPERSKTIYVGYQGHLFGYLPTSRMVEEGGYEAGEFRPSFGLEGEYYRDIDRRISYLLATS